MVSCSYCKFTPIPENVRRCPHCGSELDRSVSTEDSLTPTAYENVSNIREAMRAASQVTGIPPLETAEEERIAPAEEEPTPPQTSSATPFRPVLRPPMALLYILDDGKSDEGEIIRLRKDRTTVGRREGDVVISHDTGMSGKHVEINRKMTEGRFRWYLKDLGSTNGTFVRCDRAKLKNKFEILIGSRRFRFEDGSSPGGGAVSTMVPDNQTRPWRVDMPGQITPGEPVFVEMTPNGDGRRYPLNNLPCYIGSEPTSCDILIDNDPLVCPHHARVERDDQGNLFVEDAKSFNGTWLRIKELPLDCNCSFQCGEQRFLLRFP